ncbi:MAG TPA: acyl-CoA dehydrogenase family protein, partial [Acidimicrobiales bacterium]|nr:acyl-CoA dehydrogenase family protein [Acidimicrobiales bacterium]
MFEWSDEHLMMRQAVRQFIEKEILPDIDAYEHEGRPPYDALRKMFATFGIDAAARAGFAKRLEREADGGTAADRATGGGESGGEGTGRDPAMTLIPTIELSRYCPGMVTALGVSMGLTAAAINSRGTRAQRERWVPDLLSLAKIGAWAITEPGSGSDAFGSMASTARRDGDGYVLNGSKTFITNGPYADTIVF